MPTQAQLQSRKLGEALVERKVLSRDVLEELLDRESNEGVSLPKMLRAENHVGEKDMVAALAAMNGMRFVDFEQTVINPTLDRLIPPDLARKHSCVAVDVDGSDLLVAMANPAPQAVSEIQQATNWGIRPALASRGELQRVINAMYGVAEAPAGAVSGDGQAAETGEDGAPKLRVVEEAPEMDLHINVLLERVVELGGSDLHMAAGLPPNARVNGEIRQLEEFPVLTGSEIRRMIYAILTQKQRERFEANKELDTSHAVPGVGRFRVNVFLQRDNVGSVMRVIPYEIKPLEELGLPASVNQLAEMVRGLVLVTGPTGSGKSTTLASIIDIINRKRNEHIMTVEDPIEFLHDHKSCVVNQREVGEDTDSFAKALKAVLRQDPDVILVGEMRDNETISTALTAAETGHLVFGTLHTKDAPQSVDRIIDVFPPEQQQQIRVQLASSLNGVVTQQLVPRQSGNGRALACEILIATPAVRNLIREGKTHQIYSSMQAGGKYGMQVMDQSLAELVKKGAISMQMALERAANQEDLRRLSTGA
ncbi:MAG: PilT/PilU family type 4a pilus ATPase [Actinobacteria bacterium]|nr:PilT/PilU family type 4a pilus ATPase [Actinomycetota bacterium]